MIIDAHHHFWAYTPERHPWIDTSMHAIRRDFLPEDLLTVITANAVSGAVTVQAEQTESETLQLLRWADENNFIKGVVGWVDLCAGNLEGRLGYFSQFRKLRGFRHILQAEDPAFMLREDFQKGIAGLNRFGFTYDLLLKPQHLPAAVQLVQRHPQQVFVLDHMAKPDIRSRNWQSWAQDIRQLAVYKNVWCKVSGMITEADWLKWTPGDLHPCLDVVQECFGMDRMMFGSDWPVCLVAGEYRDWLQAVQDYFSSCSVNEKEQFFAGNAVKAYALNF